MKRIINICLVFLILIFITGCDLKLKVNYDGYSGSGSSKQEMITWQMRFEGKFAAVAASAQQTKDGGYIVAGGTCGLDTYYLYHAENYDGYFLKIDSGGNLEWEKIYGGKDNNWAACVQQTRDGGYIAAGTEEIERKDYKGDEDYKETKGVIYILKLDSNAEIHKTSEDKGMTREDARENDILLVVPECIYRESREFKRSGFPFSRE